jgi:Tfp pilus assembly protein PilF
VALIDNLQALLARGQDGALLRYSLGAEYLKQARPDQAVEHLRRALEQDPNHSAAYKLLGRALTELGQEDEARQAYEAGIRVAQDKGDIQAAKEMTVFLRRLKK